MTRLEPATTMEPVPSDVPEPTGESPPAPDRVAAPTLFVDLDGTLVRTDVLWEAFIHQVKRAPWVLVMMFVWLLGGRASLKHALASRAQIDPASLPYRDDLLAHLRTLREQGWVLILATASAHRWADAIAKHLGLFEDVIASDERNNLKGERKLTAIEAWCKQRGVHEWGYVGDHAADLPIWKRAHQTLVVEPSQGLLDRVRAMGEPTKVFGHQPSRLRPLIKALRPHQWVKNVLLFVPLLLARQYSDIDKTIDVIAAFVSFSLCASSVYVLNDMFDVEADRHHPKKRKRPFAAGLLPLALGPPLALGLIVIAFSTALILMPLPYVAVLAFYLVITSLYSTVLKSKLLVDVLILSGLYTLRIFAGGVAAELAVSEWLLAFSIFIFTSLAFAKRYVELARLAGRGETTVKGRGYQVADLSLIESFGATSGYLAVLVFALYVQNGLPSFYTNKALLWASCPFLLFWISRLWFLAKRGELDDDPVVYAVTDKVSLSIGAVIGLLVILAAPIW